MYRVKAQQALPDTPLIFSVPLDGEDFRDHIALAYDHGATHIGIGRLPRQYDAFMPDNRDPYPNWSQGALALFRLTPPEAVVPFIPSEIVQRNLAWLDQRVAAVRQRGLKLVVNGIEPMWLPEAAYQAHPRWRGVQCELGRIASKPYWCPSIDEPQVLELYRESARLLCQRYPEIERFSFWTNDCGAGLSWTTYSYPGLNGPTESRLRDPGARIAGWLEAIRQGSIDAGASAIVNVQSFSFPPAETAAIRAKLGTHLYLNSVNGEGQRIAGPGANSGGGVVGTPTNPVLGHFDRRAFVEQLQQVFSKPNGHMRSIAMSESTLAESLQLLRGVLDHPGEGVLEAEAVLLQAAREVAGAAGGDRLVRVWNRVQLAVHALAQLRQRGVSMSLSFGSTSSRWLVRPLVPQPHLLTAAEKAHYRPMLFSADGEDINANLCEILGKPVFIGDSVVWMARWCIDEAQKHLNAARDAIVTLLKDELTDAQRRVLELYRDRIRALYCVAENGRLTIMYQHALNIAHIPRYGANPLDFDDNITFDQRALELRKIARMDLDNTWELIELLGRHEVNEVLAQGMTPEQETVFMYGPNLIELLETKRAVMLAHWHDYERLYPTSKRYEFEPTPREQDFLPPSA